MINFWARCNLCGPANSGQDIEAVIKTNIFSVPKLPKSKGSFKLQCQCTLERLRDDLRYEVIEFEPSLVTEITLTLGCELLQPPAGVPLLQAVQYGDMSHICPWPKSHVLEFFDAQAEALVEALVTSFRGLNLR